MTDPTPSRALPPLPSLSPSAPLTPTAPLTPSAPLPSPAPLPEPPSLVWPTVAVRDSYLAGERADCEAEGRATQWLGPAADDFEAYVAQRRGVRERWGVPSTLFWYVSGEHYLGTLVVRHSLTPELAEAGGHIGY